jgi:UPF0716 protein FxsA
MGWILALLLLVVPSLEIGLIVQLRLPWWLAIGWCVTTAGIGWYFARGEDWTLWTELESDVQNGRVPTEEGIEGLLVLAGAWGLIVPGLFTDLAGALLLVPRIRRPLVRVIRRAIQERIAERGESSA